MPTATAHAPRLDFYGHPECCNLPKNHRCHTTPPTTRQEPPTPPLSAVRDLGVAQHPDQAPTSQAAAQSAWPRAGSRRWQVLEAIAATGEHGATDDELVEDTELPANTVRPRRGELALAGFITRAKNPDDTDRTRASNEGNDAWVWIVTEATRDRLNESL